MRLRLISAADQTRSCGWALILSQWVYAPTSFRERSRIQSMLRQRRGLLCDLCGSSQRSLRLSAFSRPNESTPARVSALHRVRYSAAIEMR